ncbi:pentatricopeptide repeat-containing protein At1g30610, chloroplastic [Rhodamnia argentea]|uniref:Pentatricopeptide repeat-containing protein At1g30610, chloroplastic n=1 Tax=Rhodamnia argentea TaxID=178133 RepID=A0A8B8QYX6_9MYRT|nr:pentatricopeptide repeat-containing protein At1g30610, chloroplastic [Rhodamnia argentea]
MYGVILANQQICISSVERNAISHCSPQTKKGFCPCGFPESRRSMPRVLSRTKARYRRINALLKEESLRKSDGRSLLAEEFEFKPSFDEYLKAMESVKSVREKRRSHNSSGLDDSLSREPEADQPNVKGEKLDGDSSREIASSIGKDGLSRDGMRKRGHKLESKEGRADGKGKREVQGDIAIKKKQILNKDSKARGTKASIVVLGSRDITKDDKLIDLRRKGGFENSKVPNKLRKDERVEKSSDDKINRRSATLMKSTRALNYKKDDEYFGEERAAFRTLDEFSDIVDKPKVSRMEMEDRIQKLAKWLNGADIDMPEWMFSKIMRSAKIKFCDYSVLRVIQILGKLGNWRRVLQVIEWLQMRERFKSNKLRHIYTAALDVLGKARRPVEALNLFHLMQNQMSTYPDLVAYRSIAVTLGQAGHMKELFDVIDTMRSPPKKKLKTMTLVKWDPQLEPDIIVYNAVLNACVKRKQWEGAFWVLQQLKQHGQHPSSITYGLVMEVMFACEKYNLVHELFRKVQRSCIPNALTYKVLVNTLWREGKTDEAVLAVQEMEKRGIVGSAALYYDLARCLCSAGRCQESLRLVEKICKVANKPLVVTYTGLIQACLEARNIESGSFIFKQMEEYCSPNLVTCNIMLKAYLDHGMFEEAKQLFSRMLDDANHIKSKSDYKFRVIPDTYTFNTILDACFEGKRWDDLQFVYQKMLQHGHHFNEKRHLRIVLDSSRARQYGLLETTWNHLVQADRLLPLPLIKERFCLMLEKDDYPAALSCLINHAASESQGFSRISWLKLFKHNAHRIRGESLVGLMHDAALHLASEDSSSVVLQTLLMSCKEFLRVK